MKKKFCAVLAAAFMLCSLPLGACKNNDASGNGGENGSGWFDSFIGQGRGGWNFGKGAPGTSVGKNGDLYLDTETNILYAKSNNTWSQMASLSLAYEIAKENGYGGTLEDWANLIAEYVLTHSHKHTYHAEQTGAPCDPNGYTKFSCECGDYYIISNYYSHLYVQGKCVYCGKENKSSLEGIVYDTGFGNLSGQSEPLSEASVSLTGEDGTQTVETDGSGRYRFEDVICGTYTMNFSCPGYYSYEVQMELTEENQTFNVWLDAEQNSALSGRITVADNDMDISNNVALGGATVTLSKRTGSDRLDRVTTSSSAGSYGFEHLPAGNYLLEVEKPGYTSLKQYITIERGESRVENMVLEIIEDAQDDTRTGSVKGKIYDAAVQGDHGVPGLTLEFRAGVNAVEGDVVLTLVTDNNGDYSAEGLAPGNYTVSVKDNRTLEKEDERYSDTYFNVKVLPDETIDGQNGYTSNNALSGQLQIILTWGSTPADLDSHLTGPSTSTARFHTYFVNKTAGPVNLDRDDTDSKGPETTTINEYRDGVYRFSVHDFSNKEATNSTALSRSNAKVEVYFGDKLRYTFYVPNKAGTLWKVFEYDTTTKTLTKIDEMGYHNNPDTIQ